jgi:limonene-1,2-epoxide hydrolase
MSSSANMQVVRRVCEHWPWLSLEEFTELLSPDCVYKDMPFPDRVCTGPAAAHGKLSPLQDDWDINFEISSAAANAESVLIERVENFVSKTGAVEPFSLRCVGVFELADGKIKAWRDYWDKAEAEPLMRFMAMKTQRRAAAP